MKKFSFSLITIILVISLSPIICCADYSSYVWSNTSDLTTLVSNNLTENYTDNTSNPLNLDCGSAILIEQTTGQVLYSYNSHEQWILWKLQNGFRSELLLLPA